MKMNNFPSGYGRTPRSVLMVGDRILHWTSWTIEHNGIYEAGSIHITAVAPYEKWSFWLQMTEMVVDVYVGFPIDPMHYDISDLTLLMSARIDNVNFDPAAATLTLSGRDLTSLFIDKKSDAKYVSKTASQIAEMVAGQFDVLSTSIQATTDLVGAYYDADQVHMQQQDSMWTLLTYLAQREGMQCFVLGRTLYFGQFGSPALGGAVANTPYAIQFEAPAADRPYARANVEKLSFSHDLTIAGDIAVRVRSYHGAKNACYSGNASTAKSNLAVQKSAKPVKTTQSYDFTFPGMTEAECKEKADKLLGEIGKHELKMEVTVPGDITTFPWTPVNVRGTGTLFDTDYQLAKISRSFDTRGFTMTMSCRTTPAQETVNLA